MQFTDDVRFLRLRVGGEKQSNIKLNYVFSEDENCVNYQC